MVGIESNPTIKRFSATRTGYEISVTRYFDKPEPLRSLEAIPADIVAVERETEGLLGNVTERGGV